MKTNAVQGIVMTGLMAALCFLGTFIIQVPIPFTNGYIHLGDSMVFLSGIILGKRRGALAAGLGSMLADFAGGWYIWIAPTFIIKAAMAFLLGWILEKGDSKKALAFFTSVYAVLWIGFSLVMTYFLRSQVTNQTAETLLTDIEGFSSASELLDKAGAISVQLFIAAALLPILIAVFLLISSKLAKVKLPFVSLIGFVISGSVMMVGYYFAAYLIYGSYIAPIFSIPANMLQFAAGAVIATLLTPVALMLRKPA